MTNNRTPFDMETGTSIARDYGLRLYQGEAVRSVDEGWLEADLSRQLVCMATGTGKTPLMSIMAKREVERGGKVLILAHTDELIDQALDKVQRFSGIRGEKEKAGSYASRFAKIVVGSVQTMSGDVRLSTWKANHFTLVMVDEAHRTLAASYLKILTKFNGGGAKIVGVTATADRGDKKSLGEFYQRIAYDYSLLHAVRDGWLIRPLVQTMPLEIDLRGVHSKATSAGSDLDQSEVGRRLIPFMKQIAEQVKGACPQGKVVYFLPSVETAELMSNAVNASGITCDWISGDRSERHQITKAYKAGQLQAITNCMLLTEGWDHDEVDTIVILRPTKIRSLFVQMAGRACRPLATIVKAMNEARTPEARHAIINASPKKAYKILDFLWLYEKHDLIRPAALVTGKQEVAEEMVGKTGDLIELEKQAERDLLKKLEDEVKKNARKAARVVDPLQMATELADLELATYEPETARDAQPATQNQIAVLMQNGIDTKAIKCRGQASILIQRILARHNKGLCTVRQLHFLAKLGIDGSIMTKEEASAIMSRKMDSWKAKEAERKAAKAAKEAQESELFDLANASDEACEDLFSMEATATSAVDTSEDLF